MILKSYLQGSVVGVLSAPLELDRSTFLPELAGRIREKFEFVDGPVTAAEFSGENVTFRLGHHGPTIIQEMIIYQNGISCQSLFPTEDLQEACDAALALIRPGLDLRWFYKSEIEVQLRKGFEAFVSPLEAVTAILRPIIERAGFQGEEYGPYGLILGDQPLESDVPRPGRFVLEWRVGHPKSENVFFSSAPLSTREHLNVLEQIEALF